MLWMILSVFSLLISWWALAVNNSKIHMFFSLGALIALFSWFASQVNLLKLGQGEESLLLWFAVGLLFLIVNAAATIFSVSSLWGNILKTVAAFSYALGLDVFRPDAFALIPAGIIGLMVILVGGRAASRLLRSKNISREIDKVAILISTSAFSLMLYASFYKLLDRGWQLPWSFMVAIGALLFALSQLWETWKKLELGGSNWRARIIVSFDLAQYLLVLSAYYHYSKYL